MFNENEILTALEVLDTVEDWFSVGEPEDVLSQFGEKPFGRIGVKEFFNDLDHQGTLLDLESLKEELGVEGGWYEKNRDNTYNYSGQMERELDFITFESSETDEVIVFYAIHVGRDVRVGYTKSIAVAYESEYDLLDHLSSRGELAYLTFTSEDEELSMTVSGESCSEYLDIYISDAENNEVLSLQEWDIDLYNKEDFIESAMQLLKENDVNFDEGSLKVEE